MDFDNAKEALKALEEEVGELKEAFAEGRPEDIADELGDVLFFLLQYGKAYGA